jgi:Holliday junction resolvasome RuvABC endonuclease subunit
MTTPSFVLAVHPHSRGFAWVVFEGPFAPYDWGLVSARREKNRVCLRKFEKLVRRYGPQDVVLETFKQQSRSDRVVRLCKALVAYAFEQSVEVSIYSRDDVRSTFESVGAVSRQEVAEAVARHIEAFRHRLPPPRKAWQSEDERLSLFTATALAVTHFRLSASRLLDELDG